MFISLKICNCFFFIKTVLVLIYKTHLSAILVFILIFKLRASNDTRTNCPPPLKYETLGRRYIHRNTLIVISCGQNRSLCGDGQLDFLLFIAIIFFIFKHDTIFIIWGLWCLTPLSTFYMCSCIKTKEMLKKIGF